MSMVDLPKNGMTPLAPEMEPVTICYLRDTLVRSIFQARGKRSPTPTKGSASSSQRWFNNQPLRSPIRATSGADSYIQIAGIAGIAGASSYTEIHQISGDQLGAMDIRCCGMSQQKKDIQKTTSWGYVAVSQENINPLASSKLAPRDNPRFLLGIEAPKPSLADSQLVARHALIQYRVVGIHIHIHIHTYMYTYIYIYKIQNTKYK